MTTSTALKLTTGNAGKRSLNFDQIFAPESAIPECPPHLTGEARKEWDRVTAELHEYKMIAVVDKGNLAMLCTSWARYVEAEKMIAKEARRKGATSGLFVLTPNGYPVQSPWVAISARAIEQYRSIAADFGLSPAARARVSPQTSQLPLPGLELVADQKIPIANLMR